MKNGYFNGTEMQQIKEFFFLSQKTIGRSQEIEFYSIEFFELSDLKLKTKNLDVLR